MISVLHWASEHLFRLFDRIAPRIKLPPGYTMRQVDYGCLKVAVDHPDGRSSYHTDEEDALYYAWKRSAERRSR